MPIGNVTSKGRQPTLRRRLLRATYRWVKSGLALLGVAALLLLATALVSNVLEIRNYRRKFKDLQSETMDVTDSSSLPGYVVAVAETESPTALVERQLGLFLCSVDSLGLRGDMRGFKFEVNVLPIGLAGFRECRGRFNLIAGCDCDLNKYDFYSFELDPAQKAASAVLVENSLTLAQIETLSRRISGIRR